MGKLESMDHVITIPKKIAQQGDLVVLPRVEFEALQRSLAAQTRLIAKNGWMLI